MNYSYYKFNLVDDYFKNKTKDLIIENGFKKIYSIIKIENIEIEVYTKTKHKDFIGSFPIYILYVKAPTINSEDLDLILNYHLIEAGVPLPISNDYVWVYAIFHVENGIIDDCLYNFIKYGMLNSFHRRNTFYKRTQLPIVYDDKNKVLFVGNRTYRRTREIFDIVYGQLKKYFEERTLDITNYSMIKMEDGTKFEENLYPERIIYTKHSKHYSITKQLFLGFGLSLFILVLLYMASSIPIEVVVITIILVICLLWATISKSFKIINTWYINYKKIKIKEPHFGVFINKFKKVLISNHYIEISPNLFSNKKTKFYLIDNSFNYSDINILSNSYVIVDSYNTYKSINISEKELATRNIVLLVYDNNFLNILNKNESNNLSIIYKLIDKIYCL